VRRNLMTFVAAAAFVAAALLPAAPATAGETSDYIVVFHDRGAQERVVLGKRPLPVRRAFHLIPGVAMTMTAAEAEAMRQRPEVAYVEPNGSVKAPPPVRVPRPSSGSQVTPWGIDRVHAPQSWAVTRGAGIRIAVLDTGLDYLNPDLPVPVAAETFVSDPVQDSTYGHGTHVAGIAVALDNSYGVVGVAPSADLMVGRVFDAGGNGTFEGIVAAIEWAVDNGADVINMSFAGPDFSQAMEDAVNAAVDAGVVVVASAGNSATTTPFYPAATPSAISVVITDQLDNYSVYSNWGSTVDMAAPGILILSTVPIGTFISATAEWGGSMRYANVITHSAIGTVTRPVYSCGIADGSDAANTCPAAVSGNIALIRRGAPSIDSQVAHAQSMGAVGAIVANNTPYNYFGSLAGPRPVVTIAVSGADGDDLLARGDGTVATASVTAADYGINNGTSMSAPHVAATAALLCDCYGSSRSPARQAAVRSAIESSAVDLGAPGRDDRFGHGLVDAYAALEALGTCGVDLHTTIVPSGGIVVAGSGANNLAHVITVTNDGPFGATGVSVDVTPAIVPGVSFTVAAGDGTSFAGSIWTIGDLGAGDSATLTITYSVSAMVATGTSIETSASAAADQSDIDGANDDATVSTDVGAAVAVPATGDVTLGLLALLLAVAAGVALRQR